MIGDVGTPGNVGATDGAAAAAHDGAAPTGDQSVKNHPDQRNITREITLESCQAGTERLAIPSGGE